MAGSIFTKKGKLTMTHNAEVTQRNPKLPNSNTTKEKPTNLLTASQYDNVFRIYTILSSSLQQAVLS